MPEAAFVCGFAPVLVDDGQTGTMLDAEHVAVTRGDARHRDGDACLRRVSFVALYLCWLTMDRQECQARCRYTERRSPV